MQKALLEHGLIDVSPDYESKELSPIWRDVNALLGHALCDALLKHLAAGEAPNATPGCYFTAFQTCFGEGKLDAMRIFINAGAKTGWTADQTSIALGEVPSSPDTGKAAPFSFGCRVGNLMAAQAYLSMSAAGSERSGKAVTNAVKVRQLMLSLGL